MLTTILKEFINGLSICCLSKQDTFVIINVKEENIFITSDNIIYYNIGGKIDGEFVCSILKSDALEIISSFSNSSDKIVKIEQKQNFIRIFDSSFEYNTEILPIKSFLLHTKENIISKVNTNDIMKSLSVVSSLIEKNKETYISISFNNETYICKNISGQYILESYGKVKETNRTERIVINTDILNILFKALDGTFTDIGYLKDGRMFFYSGNCLFIIQQPIKNIVNMINKKEDALKLSMIGDCEINIKCEDLLKAIKQTSSYDVIKFSIDSNLIIDAKSKKDNLTNKSAKKTIDCKITKKENVSFYIWNMFLLKILSKISKTQDIIIEAKNNHQFISIRTNGFIGYVATSSGL